MAITPCPANEWTLIAENTKQLKIWPASKSTNPTRYFWTIVEPLSVAPDNGDLSEAFDIERPGTQIHLNDLADVYVMARLNDGSVFSQENIRFDVNKQDQSTPPVEYWLTQSINAVTLVGDYVIGDNVLTFSAGHGFVVGNFVEIRYDDSTANNIVRFLQLEVLAVNVNDITVTPYVDFDLTNANIESAERVTADMNVLGTLIAPQRFSIRSADNLEWDVTRLMIGMILSSGGDDGKFGNLTALTNGVFFGFEVGYPSTVAARYLVNIKANAGFRTTAYDVTYTTRSGGGGDFGMSVRKSFNGADKYGVVIRLEDNTQDFVIYIQDDLQLLNEFRIKIMGHEVD